MQEEVNQKTVALSIRTTKLTGKSAGCRSWEGGADAAKAPPEGADPTGTPECEKADEPLWRQKRHALCGSPEGFLTGSRRSSMWTTLSIK